MVSAVPGTWAAGKVLSLEVRWMLPGRLDVAVADWFGRFRPGTEAREDLYLLDPGLAGLSVKLRAGGALEVKMYRGSPGLLEVPGCARAGMQSWQKWSVPFRPPCGPGGDPAGWQPVRKRRRVSQFSLASGARGGRPGAAAARCAAELTEVQTAGETWWSLGLEATGQPDLLRDELEATAAVLFAQPLPDGVALGMHNAGSYAEWLTCPDEYRGE